MSDYQVGLNPETPGKYTLPENTPRAREGEHPTFDKFIEQKKADAKDNIAGAKENLAGAKGKLSEAKEKFAGVDEQKKTEAKARFAALDDQKKAELKTDASQVKGDIESIKASVAEMKTGVKESRDKYAALDEAGKAAVKADVKENLKAAGKHALARAAEGKNPEKFRAFVEGKVKEGMKDNYNNMTQAQKDKVKASINKKIDNYLNASDENKVIMKENAEKNFSNKVDDKAREMKGEYTMDDVIDAMIDNILNDTMKMMEKSYKKMRRDTEKKKSEGV